MRLFDYETKQILSESDPTKSEEMITSGKAVELDLGELDKFEQTADSIYESFQSQSEKIKASDNPIYTKEVKDYELKRLESEYREKSAEVEKEYNAYRAKHQEEARIKAAQAVVNVTDKDKLTASQFATRANLNLATASDKSVALKKITDEIALLTDEQRTALQSEILGVLATIDDDKYTSDKKSVIAAVQSVRSPDLMAYEVAKQLPVSVLTKQRVHDIAKRVASESSALSGGGISTEFYNKHLKRGK